MNSAQSQKAVSVAVALFLLLFCGKLGAQTRPIAVLGGTLIDGTGRAAITDAAVVMEGGRFQQVGKKGQVTIPPGAEVIEAGGKTILPGLIDGHCHYYEGMGNEGELYLSYGVTTCPDLHVESLEWAVEQREGIQKGTIRGPRLWVTGLRVNGPPPSELGARNAGAPNQVIVRTPEEARKAVREEVENGADGLKFFELLTPEMAKAAAEEAHRLGRPVFGHTLNILAAADAGYQGVEHFWSFVFTFLQDPNQRAEMEISRVSGDVGGGDHLYLTPEFYRLIDPKMTDGIIRVMVDKNVHWSTTWATFFRPLSSHAADMKQKEAVVLKNPRFAIPATSARRVEDLFTFYEKAGAERRAQLLEGYKKVQEIARRFVAAGGRIHAGSDPNHAIPAFSVHEEMELMVEAGLSPEQAVQAASWNVAQAWGKQKEYGSVEKGKVADLTIVWGDAMRDIAATQNVERVFQDGKLVGGSDYKKP